MASPEGVADAMATGDCRAVLQALPAPRSAGVSGTAERLAIATCKWRGGDLGGAHAVLVGPDDTPLAGYRRLLRAQVRWASGGATAADEVLADLDGLVLPGAPMREVQLLRGQIRATRGDSAAAADLLALIPSEAGPEARYWLAELAARAGDPAGEKAALRELWLDARPGGWDQRAADRLVGLGAPVPELGTADGRALARKRLAALAERARATEAQALGDALAAVEPPPDAAAWDLLGRVRYNARDYAGALAAWRSAFGPPTSAGGSAQQRFDYALCHARTGDYDTAAVVYRQVTQAFPTTEQGDFASFKLGYMKYDRGDCAAAVPLFDEHRRRYPGSSHLDEALWFTARCAWKAGDRAAAVAAWSALESDRPKSSLVAGAAYWRARAKGIDGDAAGEKAALESVIARFPTNGYAYLAAERVGKVWPTKPAAAVPAWPAELASSPSVAR
ncbi:MAG: tetratricopeptide repeat protein, partial [Myxococcota bacterium]